jgi:hypothetical protein
MRYGLSFTDKVHIVVRVHDESKLGGRWMQTLCNGKGMAMWGDVPEWKVAREDMCRLCRRTVN